MNWKTDANFAANETTSLAAYQLQSLELIMPVIYNVRSVAIVVAFDYPTLRVWGCVCVIGLRIYPIYS